MSDEKNDQLAQEVNIVKELAGIGVPLSRRSVELLKYPATDSVGDHLPQEMIDYLSGVFGSDASDFPIGLVTGKSIDIDLQRAGYRNVGFIQDPSENPGFIERLVDEHSALGRKVLQIPVRFTGGSYMSGREKAIDVYAEMAVLPDNDLPKLGE